MADEKRRQGGGAKLARSQTVTVRLDPKLRYLAELGARKQRRTLSSFIEWAIEESLSHVHLDEGIGYSGDNNVSVADESISLWDVDEPDRFAKLALRHPHMLTHDEQIVWKLVRENGYLWKGSYIQGKWTWDIKETSLIFDRLRKYWAALNAVARGETDFSVLPTWAKERAEPEPKTNDFDDIPF
jgi:hypothetical protein